MATNKPMKHAAIDLEEIRETPLAELTADRFLAALDEEKVLNYLPYWPEKKKYELWVEPENIGRIPFERIIDIIKAEKKKTELEPYQITVDQYIHGDQFIPGDQYLTGRRYQLLLNRLADDLLVRLREQLG